MYYHYDNRQGWLGGPCGLTRYKGRYHLFYQYYPHANHYGPMYWGHLVSDDLISFEDLGLALAPDSEELGFGCSSGCAVTFGDKIYLFYGSVSEEGEGVSLAVSSDGLEFEKKGRILKAPPGSRFRTPFVFEYQGSFRMLVGSGYRVLMYTSEDLYNWTDETELMCDSRFGLTIEYPQLIELKGKWILVIQGERHMPSKVLFACGSFDGKTFEFDETDTGASFIPIETGPEFYCPVSYKNIIIGWMYSTRFTYASALSSPRTLSLDEGRPCLKVIDGLKGRLKDESRFVRYENGRLEILFEHRVLWSKAYAHGPDIKTLEDVGTVEVFMEDGTENVSLFIC